MGQHDKNGSFQDDAASMHEDAMSKAISEMPPEEQSLYNEAAAFEGAAVVSMIERGEEAEGEQQKVLEITMEDGVTFTVELDSGEKRLNELGYRQELRRVLNLNQLYSVAISSMSIFAGVVPTFTQGFVNGGPVALVWYWWISVFFVHLVGLSFAEISSSFPTAGSLYFWAAALAGPRFGPAASFFTAWMEFIGLSVGLSTVAYAGTTIIREIVAVSSGVFLGDGYVLDQYSLFGLACGTIVVCAVVNHFPIGWTANVLVVSAVWQILGGIVLIIMLPCVAPLHQTAEFVFRDYEIIQETPSAAYSFILALLVSQYSLYGYDSVAHLAEETKQSDKTAPIAIMASISTVSLIGWGIIVSALFSIQSVDSLLNTASPDSYFFVQILWDAFYGRYGSSAGVQVWLVVIYGSFFFGCIAGVLGASRVCFSLSRDGGFPFSRVWRTVNKATGVPSNAVLLSISIGILFLLPLLDTPIIFTAITSVATIGWVGAYSVPIFFRLIQPEKEFIPGPFYMADYIGVVGGKIVHFLSLIWVLYTVIVFNLPYAFPVTEQNFNWAPVAISSWLVLVLVWWIVDARFWFKGPIRELEVEKEIIADSGSGLAVEFYES